MKPTSLAGVVVVLAALAAGCRVGPDHHTPAPLGTNAMPARFDGATNGVAWLPARTGPASVAPDWWRGFRDPELDRLVRLATNANPSVVLAAARVAEARAQAGIAGAAAFPSVNLSGSHTRLRGSENAFNPGPAAGVGRTYSIDSIPLEATWEADLWGRVRRIRELANANVAAVESDERSARLAVVAEVAADVATHRELTAELRVLSESTNAFARSMDLARQRRRGGIGTDLEVSQAEAQYEGTAARIPAARLRRARVEHALAALCGVAPNGFAIADTAPGADAGAIPAIPELLPSELLERRPDIAAAEKRVEAANAGIGVAKAAFYPRFHISAMAGVQSLHGSDLFTAPSRMWSLGPGVDFPVFTGGRLRGQLAAARAEHEASVAIYRQAVLDALRETEDGLSARRELDQQWLSQNAALAAARKARDIAGNRYKAGIVSYLEVLTAETVALERELDAVRLEGDRRLASVALARALGGGWQPRP